MRNVQHAKELNTSPTCPFSSFLAHCIINYKLGPLWDIQAHILESGVRKLWSFQKMKSLESPSRLWTNCSIAILHGSFEENIATWLALSWFMINIIDTFYRSQSSHHPNKNWPFAKNCQLCWCADFKQFWYFLVLLLCSNLAHVS